MKSRSQVLLLVLSTFLCLSSISLAKDKKSAAGGNGQDQVKALLEQSHCAPLLFRHDRLGLGYRCVVRHAFLLEGSLRKMSTRHTLRGYRRHVCRLRDKTPRGSGSLGCE